MPSPVELAALDWARARIKVKAADMSDAAVFPALMRLFDQAQANLFAVCVYELAKREGTIIDLDPSGKMIEEHKEI